MFFNGLQVKTGSVPLDTSSRQKSCFFHKIQEKKQNLEKRKCNTSKKYEKLNFIQTTVKLNDTFTLISVCYACIEKQVSDRTLRRKKTSVYSIQNEAEVQMPFFTDVPEGSHDFSFCLVVLVNSVFILEVLI